MVSVPRPVEKAGLMVAVIMAMLVSLNPTPHDYVRFSLCVVECCRVAVPGLGV